MIQNSILLFMAQARFAAISDMVHLKSTDSGHSDRLSEFLPWGTIGPGGDIRAGDAYQVIGEPLIAVTRVLQDLADAASSALPASKTVLCDGARAIASDLQAFDDIADRQRVVVLASPDESEEIRLLRQRECPVWYMSPPEITIGEKLPDNRSRLSLVGRTVRTAEMRNQSSIVCVECRSGELEAVAESLENVAARLDDAEEKSEANDLLARLYGILLNFSECCFGVGEEGRSDLRMAREDLERSLRWMDLQDVRDFRSALSRLESISAAGTFRRSKADALLGILMESGGRWVIGSRSPRTADILREGLRGMRGSRANWPVVPIQTIRPQDEWDGIVLPAWPGRRRFERLGNLAAAKRILVLSYPFERRWLFSHQARERAIIESNRMDAGDRARITGIEPELLPPVPRMEPEERPGQVPAEQPMLRFERRLARRRSSRPPSGAAGEETRAAKLVDFHGGCYALITQWAQLHVLNELIDGGREDGGSLRRSFVSDLARDDFVLFRAGGGKEFIRMLAEDELGIERYDRLRAVADRWRPALERLGSTPSEVQRTLAGHGLVRTLAAISGWMWNTELIAPGIEGDLEIICRAAGDDSLLAELSEVREAISDIRGAHISAGSRLTRLILGEVRGRLDQLDDEPVRLDLGYGQAWVVQVKRVDARQEQYPADQVNRLLWTHDSII